MSGARPFHLSLVRPPGYLHASALAEAVEYLGHVLVACGERVTFGENELRHGAHNIVACAHLLGAEAISQLPEDAIVLNSEPLSDDAGWQFTSGLYRDVLARFHVWDYSQANLARIPHARVSVIPFWYRRELERTTLPLVDGGRLLFYGVLTPHRRTILEELVARGVQIDVRFGCYGEERDRAMRAALAVLNLHQRDDPRTFEPIRCFHPLINGVPVISEDTDDPTAEPFRNAMAFVRSGDLARSIAELVADLETFRASGREAARRFAMTDPLPAIATALEIYRRGL